jgi:hypothetical protein
MRNYSKFILTFFAAILFASGSSVIEARGGGGHYGGGGYHAGYGAHRDNVDRNVDRNRNVDVTDHNTYNARNGYYGRNAAAYGYNNGRGYSWNGRHYNYYFNGAYYNNCRTVPAYLLNGTWVTLSCW